jgi:hypothetical protein
MRFFAGFAVLAAMAGQQQALATMSVETVSFLTLAGNDWTTRAISHRPERVTTA